MNAKEKKPKQTPTRCQSQDRKQDYLETNKPLKLKKNETLVSLKQHHSNSFHVLLTFHLSFAAKMLMVSRSVYGTSITASQYVHGILIFPTLLFQASALVYICFNSAALEMHGGFFQRHRIEQPGDSSG